MKKPVVSSACRRAVSDNLLKRILCRCGAYYHPGDLFFQELWKQRLINIGFRVLYVEKLPYHHVWDVRVCGKLGAQIHLLSSKPSSAKLAWVDDPLPKLLQAEIRIIAQDLGAPIKRDSISVTRSGKYFRVAFIWALGKPGRLLRKEPKTDAFSFLIKPWLRRGRN